MKRLCLSLLLLICVASPAFAATATSSATPIATTSGLVKGTSDDPFASEYSDTATLSASPTPKSRAIFTSTAKTPVSGSTEDTIMLLIGGTIFILLGLRFSRTQ